MTRKTIHTGKWLNFYTVSFTHSQGKPREWEYAARTGAGGTVGVVAIEDGDIQKLILVKQFRPPIQKDTLEFPAGLVDPGETIPAAALRELREETGFVGEVTQVGPPIYSSPGMTDEEISLVTVRITGETQPEWDADEHIEVVKLPMENLLEDLQGFHDSGTAIDAKLWSFAQGLYRKLHET